MSDDNDLMDQLKMESKLGGDHIISKIFSTLLEPILKGFEWIKDQIAIKYVERRLINTMSFVENTFLLSVYLEEHNFDCLILYSDPGFKFKFLEPVFVSVKSKNKHLKKICNNNSHVRSLCLWMWYCMQHKSFSKGIDGKFGNDKLDLYFSDYEKIFWRVRSSMFYCVMSGGAILTNEDERYINNIIDNFLTEKRRIWKQLRRKS